MPAWLSVPPALPCFSGFAALLGSMTTRPRPRRRCAGFAPADRGLALSTATRHGFCRALRWPDFLRCLVLVGSSCPRRCPATTARSRVLARGGPAPVGPGVPALVRPRRWSSGVQAAHAFEHPGQAYRRVVGVLDGQVEVARAWRSAGVGVPVDVDRRRRHCPTGRWLGVLRVISLRRCQWCPASLVPMRVSPLTGALGLARVLGVCGRGGASIDRRPWGWWTRAQWLRTVSQVPIEAEFLRPLELPVYQSIAADAAAMHERGAPVSGIAKHFCVDHHTAAKALRWFRSR